jgi:hexosaminidase
MCKLFPDEYIHIGGDENNGRQWDANPEIQAFMVENYMESNHELQSYFNRRLLEILNKNGKRMVGWEEILQPEMPKSIVIQSWRGTQALIDAATKGYQAMLSNGYYIDLIQPTDFHYLNDPLPQNHSLTAEQQKLILGGEATMWGEQITLETVDSRIWPRTAAIAERYWSPSVIRDVDDMYRRMKIINFQLEEHGLTHEKNYPMMLRRLTGGREISSLKILVDVLEPVKRYSRNAQSDINQLCPYTRIVDAARPDQEVARKFRKKVSIFLADNSEINYESVIKDLRMWMGNHNKLSDIIRANPVLREIGSISADLSLIAEIGLHAAELISVDEKAEESWIVESKEMLKAAKNPRGQVELMIVSAIEKLVEKCNK